MFRDLIMINNKIMKALGDILANENITQNARRLNFDKEEQVRDEIDELGARKDEELEHIILRNRYLGRLIRGTEEKRLDEIEKSTREKENELGDLRAIGNKHFDRLLKLDKIKEHMKIMLEKTKLKQNELVIRDYISDIITSLQCIIIPEQTECDLASYKKLINSLITLRLVLKDAEKTEKTLKLEIKNKLKELEQKKINELKLLEEETFL